MKRVFDITLAAIFVCCAVALFLAHEDPFARKALCAYIPCPHLPNASAWHKIVYDLAAGALITLVFYGLVVRLPDYQRRQRLKRSLKRYYRGFRKDCIEQMLLIADGSYDSDVVESLMSQERFKEYFKQRVGPCGYKDRLDEFQNNLNEYNLRQLLDSLEKFREEVIFILNNTDVPDDEAYEFLKRLSRAIHSMRNLTPDYDDAKRLAGFFWAILAGWDVIRGYREDDIIQKMIDAI